MLCVPERRNLPRAGDVCYVWNWRAEQARTGDEGGGTWRKLHPAPRSAALLSSGIPNHSLRLSTLLCCHLLL